MLVFLDTEFTSLSDPQLISIALVAEDKRHEFYAELTDINPTTCSEFVRQEVLPLRGRIEGASCFRANLPAKLREWFARLPEPASIVFDYYADWDLLIGALGGKENLPANCARPFQLSAEITNTTEYQQALNWSFSRHLPCHHALADARAIRAGYCAWRWENQRDE